MFYTISNNTVNDLFQDLDSVFNPPLNTKNNKSHKTEITDDGITLTMDTPGYNKSLIDVTVEDKTLIIEGKSNTSDTNGFKEKFTISDKFDVSGVEASIVDGVLTISLPYKAETKPHKVKVKVG
jgi:HSP20 family molecular chaperone IbpA